MTAKRLIAAVVLVIVAGGAAWLIKSEAAWSITNARPSGTNVIAFGDSLTAGVGAQRGESWPSQLEQRLGITIENKGVSGQTTADALKRIDRDVVGNDPRIVIVLLGGNDFLQKRDKEAAFEDLRTIVNRIHQAGALVILVGLDFPLASSWSYRYRELAQETGCEYVPDILDGILGDRSLMADSVHPNGQGYTIVADRIEPVLAKYVGAAATSP